MKTDIKSLLEFAGVDITKGKARQLVEADVADVKGYHILEIHSGEDIYYAPPTSTSKEQAEAFLKDSETEKVDIEEYGDEIAGDEDGKKFTAAIKANPGGQLYAWHGWVNEDGEPLFGENPEEEEEDPGTPFVGNEMKALIYKTS